MRPRGPAACDTYRPVRRGVFLLTFLTHALASAQRGGIDDAYITYTFARNLAGGHGIAWSPGEAPMYASSTITWLLVLAAAARVGLPIPLTSTILGAALWGLVGALLVSWVRRERGAFAAAGVGALCVVSIRAVSLSVGMETALFVALALLVFGAVRAGRLRMGGLLAALLVLTRLDGLSAVAVVVGQTMLSAPAGRTARLRAFLLPFTLALGAGLVALLLYFGQAVPGTMHAKLAGPGLSPPFGPWGLVDALRGFGEEGLGLVPWIALPLAAAGLLHALGRWREPDALPRLWAIAHLALFTASRIPETPWYYAAALPSLALAEVVGADLLRLGLRGRGVPAMMALAVSGAPLLVHAALAGRALVRTVAQDPWGARRLEGEEHVGLAKRIDADRVERGRAQATIIAAEVGILGYMVPGRVHDLMGLVSPQVVAQGPYHGPRRLLEETRADYVAVWADPWAVPLAALLQSPAFVRDYVQIGAQIREAGRDYRIYRREPAPWRSLARVAPSPAWGAGEVVALPQGLPGDALFAVCVEATATRAANSNVHVDVGRGLDLANPLELWLAPSRSEACGRFAYPGTPRAVRVDAPAEAHLAVHAVEVFDGVREPPGVAAQRACLTPPTGPLEPFSPSHDLTRVSMSGDRVFAHPPSGFALHVPAGARLTGEVDLEPATPSGGDGVTFGIHVDGAPGWSHHARAGERPAGFDLTVAGAPGVTRRMGFVTGPGPSGNLAFDWARWRVRVQAPGLDFALPRCAP
jgi:hypothetical protein